MLWPRHWSECGSLEETGKLEKWNKYLKREKDPEDQCEVWTLVARMKALCARGFYYMLIICYLCDLGLSNSISVNPIIFAKYDLGLRSFTDTKWQLRVQFEMRKWCRKRGGGMLEMKDKSEIFKRGEEESMTFSALLTWKSSRVLYLLLWCCGSLSQFC